MIRSIAVLTMAAALLAAAPAQAQVQTKGPEVFPGKLQVGFHQSSVCKQQSYTDFFGYFDFLVGAEFVL